MAITSKVDICNMALSHLGNNSTITNIDTPSNDKELTFALWYDVARQAALKEMMPNFALRRGRFAKLVETPAFGYGYAYDYPTFCLKVLGIGDVKDKENNYAVEGGRIYTDIDDADGLPVRYIRDITDVTKYSPEFKMAFSWYLAGYVCLQLTQDPNKASMIWQRIPMVVANLSGLNAQENMPIRKSSSLVRQARYQYFPNNTDKK